MVVPAALHQGFDLLDPSHDTKKLEDLPKVALMEDEGGNIHLRYVPPPPKAVNVAPTILITSDFASPHNSAMYLSEPMHAVHRCVP